jgi:hypothetical protein
VTTNGCFLSKATKNLSLSWKRDDRFSAQNGKDEPNPRAARAWQEKTIKERNVNKSRCDMLIDRLLAFQSAMAVIFMYGTLWTWRGGIRL